jgi:hypothetical protein
VEVVVGASKEEGEAGAFVVVAEGYLNPARLVMFAGLGLDVVDLVDAVHRRDSSVVGP